MSPEMIFGIVVAGVIALTLLGKLLPKRQPKEKRFKCARCGEVSRHTERTIEARRNNKHKFFCQACHASWLQSRPRQERTRVGGSSRSGCLGIVVLFALIPVAGYFAVLPYV